MKKGLMNGINPMNLNTAGRHSAGGLHHTDFEGYKAISLNTVNDIPRDMNALKDAMHPKQYVSPLSKYKYNSKS